MCTVRKNISEGKYTNQLPFGYYRSDPNWCEQRNAYEAEARRLLELFKADLEVETNHPKKDDLFQLAWEYGHSDGFNEILYFYNDLSKLVK